MSHPSSVLKGSLGQDIQHFQQACAVMQADSHFPFGGRDSPTMCSLGNRLDMS